MNWHTLLSKCFSLDLLEMSPRIASIDFDVCRCTSLIRVAVGEGLPWVWGFALV